MNRKIKWGIIGCGNVTEVKSGPAFSKVNNSELVAVMRRNGEYAKDYALRHNVPRWYDDSDSLINDPEVNAVYVATPPGSHAEYAIKAMMAGKPVYVEKPMAASYSECQEMNRVSRETGVPLFVAYYRRMLPGFLKVKELIDSGSIGKPIFFSVRYFSSPHKEDFLNPLPWRVFPEISGGGYIFDLGSHQLDFIDYVLGPIEQTSSLAFNLSGLYDPEDFVSASFKCENGTVGTGVWNFTAPQYLNEDTIEIAGDKGSIHFSCFDFSPIRITIEGKTSFTENPRPEHVQQPFIETIVAELNGYGECPGTGITAARTNRVLDKITGKVSGSKV
jgi:predicted dehydrogenase